MFLRCSFWVALVVVGACSTASVTNNPADGARRAAAAESDGPSQSATTGPLARTALLRPKFATTEGEVEAGSAFVVRHGDATLLLTAQHLFGEAGGMSRELSAAEMPTVVKSVRAVGSEDERVVVQSGRLLPIAGASAVTQEDASRDLAAFVLDDSGGGKAFELAAQVPGEGEPIQLLAQPFGASTALFTGRVAAVDAKMLVVVFDDPALQLSGASGAPVLDGSGRVIGLLVSGGVAEDTLVGIANPASAIRSALSRALNGS
jgi:hypothetical protein